MSNQHYLRIKAKAKLLNAKTKASLSSPSYNRVVGILTGLGFLIAPEIKPLPTSKVDFDEALNVGMNIEPRVLEVLPAAILSFPKSFLHTEKAPEEFRQVIQALKNRRLGPDFQGIKFQKFLEAANRPVKNRKTKIISEKRIPKTYRLSVSIVEAIAKNARREGIDHTKYIEKLVESNSRELTDC